MAIRTVNGQNAYVIEAEVPTARTSNGEGYAQLVTSLRWKLWEEAQKSELQQIQFEKMAFDEQMAYYRQQQRDIRNRIGKYDIEMAKLAAGDSKSSVQASNKEIDDKARLDKETRDKEFAAAKANQGSTTSRTSTTEYGGTSVTTGTGGKGGRGKSSSEIATDFAGSTTEQSYLRSSEASGTAKSGLEGEDAYQAGVDASVQEAEYQLGAAGGVNAGDAEKFRAAQVAREIEAARSDALNKGGDADAAEAFVKSQFPAAYVNDWESVTAEAAQAGVPGVGTTTRTGTATTTGTSKTSKQQIKPPTVPVAAPDRPSVDTSAVRAQLQAERDKLEAELKSLQMPSTPNINLLERSRERFASAYGEGGFGIMPRKDKILPSYNEPASFERAKSLAAEGAEAGFQRYKADKLSKDPAAVITPEEEFAARRQGVLDALSTVGGREIGKEDFLSRGGQPIGVKAQPKVEAPTPRPVVEEEEIVIQPAAPAKVKEPSVGDIVPLPPTAGMEPPPVPMGEAGAPPSYADAMEGFRRIPPPKPAPVVAPAPVLSPEISALGLSPEEMAQLYPSAFGEGRGFAPEVAGPPPIRGLPAAPVAPTIAPEPAPIPAQPPAPRMSLEEIRAGLEERKRLKEREAADKKAVEELQKRIGLDKLPSAPPPQKEGSSSIERREAYKLAVLKKASKLAEQPKKFERLAKPDLAPEARRGKVPEYVLLVDNLYDSNRRSGNDPVSPSFEELNRVYASQPEVREAAQEYLLAKSLLESKSQNPEA
jgi:hypothetical protein